MFTRTDMQHALTGILELSKAFTRQGKFPVAEALSHILNQQLDSMTAAHAASGDPQDLLLLARDRVATRGETMAQALVHIGAEQPQVYAAYVAARRRGMGLG
jgi:hypothetical protein